jgi:hypothetical protein
MPQLQPSYPDFHPSWTLKTACVLAAVGTRISYIVLSQCYWVVDDSTATIMEDSLYSKLLVARHLKLIFQGIIGPRAGGIQNEMRYSSTA